MYDWCILFVIKLHLQALESFIKHFFAQDKLVYAHMIPLYLADMDALSESDVGIYDEFLQRNWVVNKNGRVPFCAIGADHAHEHINRTMKVAGGLTGITLNAYARSKFFLISPELARLAGEAREIAGCAKRNTVKNQGEAKDGVEGTHAAEKVAIVDAMAEVQSLQKPAYITNCSQLADQFSSQILQKYSEADEVHLVFDRYNMHKSLKTDMRERRQESKLAISYHITDTTNIAKIPMTRILSHVKTKSELTNYLTEKILATVHAQRNR